jgi:hypothetical protein
MLRWFSSVSAAVLTAVTTGYLAFPPTARYVNSTAQARNSKRPGCNGGDEGARPHGG